MKEFNKISLIHKHLSGDLSIDEKKAFDSLLQSSDNEELAKEITNVWDMSAEYKSSSFQPNAAKAFNKFKDQIKTESNSVTTENSDVKISLIHKHLSGVLNIDEKKAYETLLDSSDNKQLAKDLSSVWDMSAEYKPTSFQPDAAKAFNKFKDQIQSETISTVSKNQGASTDSQESTAKVVKMNPMKWAARIAASLLFIMACFYLIDSDTYSESYDTEIFAEAIQNTSLEDGSSIWLDDGATLAVANDFGTDDRKLKLSGKAFFDVERDVEKPFIVDMGGNMLEVLGTSFNIDNTSKDVIVEVRSGLVKVSTKSKSIELKAGQKAVLNYDLDRIEVGETAANTFDWFESKLVIKDMLISDAMDRIADYYQVNIDLSSNVDKKCLLTSPLATDSSLEDLFGILKMTHNMQYEKLGSKDYKIKFLDCK